MFLRDARSVKYRGRATWRHPGAITHTDLYTPQKKNMYLSVKTLEIAPIILKESMYFTAY